MLTKTQIELIVTVDQKVKDILANNGAEKTILITLLDHMPAIKQLMDTVTKKEIELYFQEYDGFFHYMKILENVAQGIADGVIKVP